MHGLYNKYISWSQKNLCAKAKRTSKIIGFVTYVKC